MFCGELFGCDCAQAFFVPIVQFFGLVDNAYEEVGRSQGERVWDIMGLWVSLLVL